MQKRTPRHRSRRISFLENVVVWFAVRLGDPLYA